MNTDVKFRLDSARALAANVLLGALELDKHELARELLRTAEVGLVLLDMLRDSEDKAKGAEISPDALLG